MMRSMFSGVSGTRAHQLRMDVIGNNIANVNTIGFKYGRATFQDVLSQTLKGASAPRGGRGGIDPMQVGLGVATRSIDTVFTPGSVEFTGRLTDMAIQGNGFFITKDGAGALFFTRDGAFKIDGQGQLTHPSTGNIVQGWVADVNGNIDRTQSLTSITIPLGTSMNAAPTSTMAFVGNLDAGTAVGTVHTTSVPVYDSLGVQHIVSMTYEKTASNTWAWSAYFGPTMVPDPADPTSMIPATPVGSGAINFTDGGKVDSVTTNNPDWVAFSPGTGAADLRIKPELMALTQYGGTTSVNWNTQDGFAAGSLETFNIDDRGLITGVYSNGQYQILGQMALAGFANPEGLMRSANNMFCETTNSGAAQIGEPGIEGRGGVLGTSIEMSNVDLSREFTDMIITQRGFQANSRVITAADEMLQELLALKR